MNRLYFTAIAGLALAATACHQSGADPQPATGLVGEWAWMSSTGGLAGATYTPASTGTTITWVFRADSTVQVRSTRQGVAQPIRNGTYSMGTISSIHTGQPARSLTLRLTTPETYVLQELGNHLVVSDNNYDGFGSTYQRQ